MTAFAHAPALRHHWFAVARSDDVAPGPVAVRLLGDAVVLYRSAGGVVAAPDRCPHREMPLSCGATHDGVLACSYHGWAFGDGGRCTAVPSSPAEVVPPAAHLPVHHAQERYGLVWVALDEPAAPLPRVEHDDDPAFRRITTPVEVWRTAATRMVDNFCDIAHFPYVHLGTFGAAADPVVPPVDLEPLGDFVGYRYEVDVTNQADGTVASQSSDAVLHRTMTTGFALPTLVRSTIRYESGLEHVLLLCSTPCDDTTSLFTFVVWRNDDHTVPADEVIAFDRAIGAEDRVALERIPGTLPLGRTELVSTQADRAGTAWRRAFAELVGRDD
jgi:phenylpropionate dioxygenase-like ring-hydroxylating dioxygenase large terminal subunit